jgi:hypothetical protein
LRWSQASCLHARMYGGVHRWSIFGAWGLDTTLLSVALGLLLLCEGYGYVHRLNTIQ